MINWSRYPLWLLGLSATQAGAVLVFLSFAGALPIFQAEWALSNTQAGIIQAAGQVGYLLAVLVSSSLTDYVIPKHLIVGGAIWAGVSNLAFVFFANGFTSAMILRAFIGIGVAFIYMPGVKFISQHIPSAQRGRAVGLFVASFTLGSAASIALGGNLASILGWQLAFALMSIGPLAGALISWRTLPKAESQDFRREEPVPFSELLKNQPAVLVILLYICHAWEVLGIRSWLAAYLTAVGVQNGASLAAATRSGAMVTGLATLAAATATASVASLSDRFGRKMIIIAVMAISLFATSFLGLTFTFPWLLVVLVSLVAAFFANADSAVISTSLTEVVPSNYLGRTLAIYSFLGFAAGSISPFIFGAALDFANSLDTNTLGGFVSPWSWGFATLALGSLVGLLVAVIFNRSRVVPNDSSQE
ncbi:MAG: MFS transporter [Anaerolineales bacterium]